MRDAVIEERIVDEESTQIVRALRAAFASAPVPDCPFTDQPSLEVSQMMTLKRVQTKIRSESAEALDLACLLAYFNVDYVENTRKLLIRCAPSSLPSENGMEAYRTLIPGHLARLYDRWKDPVLLAGILDASVNDRDCFEAILALWDDYWLTILMTASASSFRCRRIARALLYVKQLYPRHDIFYACMQGVRRGLYLRDGPLRKTCLEILNYVQFDGARPRRGIRRL